MSTATPSPGEALYRELLWVHDALRADLERVRTLAADTLAGAEPERVEAEVANLRTNSPLWRLRSGCLAHCRFVHQHHRLEDLALFPALLRANPEIAPVVDKLAADHRSIADRVDEVEAAVTALGAAGDAPGGGSGERPSVAPAREREARERVATTLERLGEELLEHLAFEEQNVAETMRAMTSL